MKEFIFKLWKRKLEVKISNIQDNERIEYLTRMLWDELERSNNLLVRTGGFKQVEIQKFPSDNKIDVRICGKIVIEFNTDKY